MTKLEMMQLSQGLSDLYTGLETDIIANIAEYLASGNIDSPTAQWKIQMLAQMGALDKANIATIAQYAGIAPDMLTEALEVAALTAIEELEPGFKNLVKDSIISDTDVPVENTMARALKSYNKQAKRSLNMVNTVMRYKAKSAAQKVVNDTAELAEKQSFIDTLNKATGKAVTDAESRQAAMRQCIKEMSEKGIPAFVDKRGREWSPEAYVNMDIRTTVSNVAHQSQFDRMEDYGLNLVEVSSHSGARPKCAKDQGKIFNRSGSSGYTTDLHGKKIRYYAWSDSSYGEPDGLLGINCGHHIYPFIPGVSYQTYFPYNDEENSTQYKKVQGQRELERRVRKSKRECMALEKTGDTEGLQKAKETLKTRQQALKQYCADNDLKYKPDRTAVVNYKNSISGFAPTDDKNRTGEIKVKTVDSSKEKTVPLASQHDSISELSSKAAETLKNNYEANRNHFNLNLVPADEVNDKWVSYKGLSPEIAEDVDKVLSDLQSQYYSTLSKIEVKGMGKASGIAAYVEPAGYNASSRMELNSDLLKDKNFHTEIVKFNATSKSKGAVARAVEIVDGKETDYFVTHEFAHSVFTTRPQKELISIYGEKAGKTIDNVQRKVKKIYKDYVNEIGSLESELFQVEKELENASDDFIELMSKHKEIVNKIEEIKISKYAAENVDEFIAESFTQMRIGKNKSPYAQKTGELIDNVFKKSATGVDNSGESGIIKESEKVEIHPDKINKFLLKPGAKHSKEFFDVGYSENDYERLYEDIVNNYDESKAVDIRKNDNGIEEFSTFMNLGIETKKRFRIVWRKDSPDSKPRLITGHRED